MKKFNFTFSCLLICLFIFIAQSTVAQYQVPELLYYKFNETGTNSTQNYAIPGVGSNTAPVLGLTMGPTGQFGSALIGNGGSSSSYYVNTGWATSVTGNWTISLWLNNLHSTTALNYIFGDITANSWRCFYSGAAGVNGVLLRLAVVGGSDITVPNVGPGPTVLTFVYDSSIPEVRAYKNGTFSNSQPQAGPIIISGTGPFKVGGYGSSSSMPTGSLLDEFRFYNRALSPVEITATWNHQLPFGPIVLFYDQFPNLVNWTVTNDGGTCVWQVYSPPFPNAYTLPGTSLGPLVAADADNCGSGTTTMTTLTLANNVNCTGYDHIAVEWDNDWRHLDAQDIARAQVSYNGGVTWVTLAEWGGVSKRNSHELFMLPGATNNPNVKVRFVSIQPGWDWWWAIDNVKISADIISNIKTVNNEIPDDYSLSQNYPNPFNPTTSIDFSIPDAGMVTLKVYDMLGKEITTLVDEFKGAGTYTVEFDGTDISSGTYFYRMQSDDFIKVKRMMLVK